MSVLLPFIIDVLLFILVPFIVWRLLQRTIPIAVLPILTGLLLAASGLAQDYWQTPSVISTQLGFLGVLLLAFTAGLETRHTPSENSDTAVDKPASVSWLMGSAANALIIPFIAGSVAAYFYFNHLPGWDMAEQSSLYSAMAIGLCVAVSALPVLIGIVRELKPEYQPLGKLALKVAVIDDVVLWTGLAILLILASSGTVAAWGYMKLFAVLILVALVLFSTLYKSRNLRLPLTIVWLLAAIFLAAASWATYQLGLHALLGAYFAGAIFPQRLIKHLPTEKLGLFSLFILAPLFFGYSGLRINAEALNQTALLAAFLLLLLSMLTKIGAVMMFPPAPDLSRRETLATGTLLQCKGLMEIVAATILHDQGLISEYAYAALVTLAVLSTTLTGPLFRLCFKQKIPTLKTPDCPSARGQ